MKINFNFLQISQVNYKDDPTMKEFGINIGNNFETVQARVLDPPILSCKDNSNVRISRGVWNSSKFFETTQFPRNWTLMAIDRSVNDRDLMTLADKLIQAGEK